MFRAAIIVALGAATLIASPAEARYRHYRHYRHHHYYWRTSYWPYYGYRYRYRSYAYPVYYSYPAYSYSYPRYYAYPVYRPFGDWDDW